MQGFEVGPVDEFCGHDAQPPLGSRKEGSDNGRMADLTDLPRLLQELIQRAHSRAQNFHCQSLTRISIEGFVDPSTATLA